MPLVKKCFAFSVGSPRRRTRPGTAAPHKSPLTIRAEHYGPFRVIRRPARGHVPAPGKSRWMDHFSLRRPQEGKISGDFKSPEKSVLLQGV